MIMKIAQARNNHTFSDVRYQLCKALEASQTLTQSNLERLGLIAISSLMLKVLKHSATAHLNRRLKDRRLYGALLAK